MELWSEMQSSTTDWSLLLNGSGGKLKAEKCFGYLIDYEWDKSGAWRYRAVEEFKLYITSPEGDMEYISIIPVTEPRVTLGVATCPTGDDTYHLTEPGKPGDKWKSVGSRAEIWLTRLKNGHLPAKYSWVSYRLQLWASVRYGLGVLSAPLSSMGELTKNFAFRALPYLGINRNIKAGWRYLHSAFSGCNLYDLATEAVIARLNIFLQHWDNPAPIGKAMRASMEALQLEVGCLGCPLFEPFYPMGQICTHSWLRSFWEAVQYFRIQVEIDYPVIPIPRDNDIPIMDIGKQWGLTTASMLSINRCRLATGSIHLSDICSANGRYRDHSRSSREHGVA
jgi:hypothetical protein